jgi:hypothetical protein
MKRPVAISRIWAFSSDGCLEICPAPRTLAPMHLAIAAKAHLKSALDKKFRSSYRTALLIRSRQRPKVQDGKK